VSSRKSLQYSSKLVTVLGVVSKKPTRKIYTGHIYILIYTFLTLIQASSSRTVFVPAGGAGASLPPQPCTRLTGVNCSTSQTWPVIIGDRAFQAAAASTWNHQIESLGASLSHYRSRLKRRPSF